METDPAASREDFFLAFRRALMAANAKAARREFARAMASCLTSSGNVLWAVGLGPRDFRTAASVATQMAGELVKGCVGALEQNNLYAAAVLVRQLVEIQYLLWIFSEEPEEAAAWLKASPEDLRTKYSPANMRKRSQGRFRDKEYWTHCELGGHPSPKAHFLLPERIPTKPLDGEPTVEMQWVDLDQHVEGVWELFVECAERGELTHVGLVSQSIARASDHIAQWHKTDECADKLPIALIEVLSGSGR